jgi:hypothetical protein
MDPTTPALVAALASSAAQLIAFGALAFNIRKARTDFALAEQNRLEDRKEARREKLRDIERLREDKKVEAERARDEKRLTKRAEIAGEVLVSTLRLLTSLNPIVSVFGSAPQDDADDPRDEHAHLRRDTQERWAAAADAWNAFVRSWELAETYLPDAVHQLLERIHDLRGTIRSAQHTYLATPVGGATEYFAQGWGRVPQEKLDAIRAEARALLRPMAQLKSPA